MTKKNVWKENIDRIKEPFERNEPEICMVSDIKSIALILNAHADYVKYKCDVNELYFTDTFVYEVSIHNVITCRSISIIKIFLKNDKIGNKIVI